MYLSYIPSAQLGHHIRIDDPSLAEIFDSREAAEKCARWNEKYCGNVKGNCIVEEYDEARSVSKNRKTGKLLLTSLVPSYESGWQIVSPSMC